MKNVATIPPEAMLAAALVGGTSGLIERQEAHGQSAFCHSDTLPVDFKGATREELEAIGFVFGEVTDKIFLQCKLPAGWTRRPTEHSMWSEIYDEKDHRRAQVFYKAAFYDCHAHAHFDPRYSVKGEHVGGHDANDATNGWTYRLMDGATGAQIGEAVSVVRADFTDARAFYDADDKARRSLDAQIPSRAFSAWSEA